MTIKIGDRLPEGQLAEAARRQSPGVELGCLLAGPERLEDPADGQAHHIVKIAIDIFYACDTNPFLYSIGAGFIVRLVFINVKYYLFFCKFVKENMRNICKT